MARRSRAPASASPFRSTTSKLGDAALITAAGVAFVHPPMKMVWGYGAELLDPDGYRLQLWDETSMREKGGG